MSEPTPVPSFAEPASTTRSVNATDWSNRHTSSTTFTPPEQLHVLNLEGLERPRSYSPVLHQGPQGPHASGLEGVSEALHATAGRSMERSAQKERESEQRRAAYGSQQPMPAYEPRPSYGGHDFGRDEGPVVDNHEGEESPEQRYGSRWMD
jgi:hypothetical protein